MSVWRIPGSQLKAGETVENKRWRTTAPGCVLECPGDASLQKRPELSPGWAGIWQQWHLLFCPSHSIPSLGSGSNTRLIPLCFAVVVQYQVVSPWAAARQAPLSFTLSQSLIKFMSIESVMLSNHLILRCPLLLP